MGGGPGGIDACVCEHRARKCSNSVLLCSSSGERWEGGKKRKAEEVKTKFHESKGHKKIHSNEIQKRMKSVVSCGGREL
jgi:hypothetical protein